ncbi:MAG TPA: hypothetical protein VMZ00_08330, partial [Sporichthya sp.]|nr:hypothetical protein [Sporichthya sp.]
MRSAPARRRRMYIPGRRILTLLPFVALPIVVAADLGSLTLVKVSVEDDAGEAARAGMSAFEFDRTVDQQDAEEAFRAATQVARLHDLTIDPKTFVVEADGSV